MKDTLNTSAAVIEAKGLNLTFETGDGPVHALKDVNLTVNRGEFVSFIGPSGCGKTTFLRCVAALEHPTGGTLTVNGMSPDEARMKRRWQLDEVSPFEEVRVLDPEPVRDILDDAEKHLKDYYPVFRDMRIAERWAGCIDATPDAVPVISKVEALPGLHLCTGFSGHGFGLGPGAGKLMAEILTGETTCVDASPFRYGRFFDGTRPKPTTGL